MVYKKSISKDQFLRVALSKVSVIRLLLKVLPLLANICHKIFYENTISNLVKITHLAIYHHCVKSVHIRSFSDPYFSAFGLKTEIYSVNLRIQSECKKIRTRKIQNTDNFYKQCTFCNSSSKRFV